MSSYFACTHVFDPNFLNRLSEIHENSKKHRFYELFDWYKIWLIDQSMIPKNECAMLILPAYFYSLTSLVKTHFWMKNRDITCVWADTLSIRIFSMRRIRIWYPFFPYPRKIIVFRWKCNFRSKNREVEIDVLSKNDRNYIFPRCRYHHSTRLDE